MSRAHTSTQEYALDFGFVSAGANEYGDRECVIEVADDDSTDGVSQDGVLNVRPEI